MKQVVAALILRGSEVLICQRTRYQPMALQWEFPGGKIEPGEDARSALERELDEELGIRAEIGAEVATIAHTYKNGNAIELHFFQVESYEGEIENRIFKDVRWVERDTLPQFDFLEADKALVEDIAAGNVV
ncbi:MAG: (deoxy)nucleoside triphosphate pyrophosphohydrolase [Acidobacteriaceae bacterium]